jgi:S1-C subfamily serine protease
MINLNNGRARSKMMVGLCLALFLSARVWGADETLRKSVVKLFTTAQSIDYYEPWKPGAEVQLQGCGTILPGQRILTTAHLVNKGNYIEVQKFGETRRYVAKVEQVGYDLDLALLSVEDPDFFTDTKAVEFGDLPDPGAKLVIQGGDELSIKEDAVSNMEMVWSNEGGRSMPALLTNGAIDAPNNGCPVFSDGKFVGIPFDSTGKPDKTGSIIPINVIQRFFKGIAGARAYDGVPDIGFYTQDLENPTLRDYFKISPKQTGEIITQIFYGGSADGILNVGDVLTAIDGHPVDDEGYIKLPKIGRVPECYLATFYLTGEKMSLEIVRDGQPMKIQMPLKAISQLLPDRQDNRHPTYFVMAGFVFVPLTANYFSTANWDNFRPELQDLFFHGLQSADQKQVILISHVLPHAINKGYDKLTSVVVTKVNGQPITEMKDILEAFEHPVDGYDVIEIDDHDWFGSTIVVEADKTKQATDEIMDTFKIRSDRSEDLK